MDGFTASQRELACQCCMTRRGYSGVCFVVEFAQILDEAGATAGLAGDTGIAAMQDQPVVDIEFEFGGYMFEQLLLDLVDVLARGKPGTVGDAEDMGIHRDGWPTKGGIEHHIGGLATDAG